MCGGYVNEKEAAPIHVKSEMDQTARELHVLAIYIYLKFKFMYWVALQL